MEVNSPTEERNPRTLGLDAVPTLDMLRLINEEDKRVPSAVARALPAIAELVDEAAVRVQRGGVVHYVGAGTSGRLAVLDAAELGPTFDLEPGIVVAHMAGGSEAFLKAQENVEDSSAAGMEALDGVGADDVVIGIAASGRTPFVGGALLRAQEASALTALITSNPASPLLPLVKIPIVADTGPEALTGSTRMKSGTAQKVILHTFSTGLMVRLGKTWSNLMTRVRATNDKLRARTIRILTEAAGVSVEEAREELMAADGDLPVAMVTTMTGVGPGLASQMLDECSGSIRDAVSRIQQQDRASATRGGIMTERKKV